MNKRNYCRIKSNEKLRKYERSGDLHTNKLMQNNVLFIDAERKNLSSKITLIFPYSLNNQVAELATVPTLYKKPVAVRVFNEPF